MNIPARTIKARKAKSLSFISKGGGQVFAKSVTIPGHSVRIPARPFIVFQPDDKRFVVRVLRREVTNQKGGTSAQVFGGSS